MAQDTSTSIRNLVIYSVFVRNHTHEGTLRAVIPDLPRIHALGTDVVWLMPIHPIGEKNRTIRSARTAAAGLDGLRNVSPQSPRRR